ncbi:MAG: hypothetical protein AB7O98_13775 [Hyphomonadaceae bacterium]
MAEGRNTITLSLAGIGAVLGVVATGWSARNSQRISQEQHFNNYQLGVFNEVMEALDKTDPDRIFAVQMLVTSMPSRSANGAESMRENLLKILCDRANRAEYGAAVREACNAQATEVPETAATQATQVVEAPAASIDVGAVVPPPQQQMQPLPTTPPQTTTEDVRSDDSASPPQVVRDAVRSVREQARPGALWNIDVFHCEGVPGAQERAQAAFDALSEEARSPTADAGISLGRVRLRPLPANINDRPSYGVNADEIRSEAGEAEAAASLRAVLQARSAPAVRLETSGVRTPYYMSAFFCGGGSSSAR